VRAALGGADAPCGGLELCLSTAPPRWRLFAPRSSRVRAATHLRPEALTTAVRRSASLRFPMQQRHELCAVALVAESCRPLRWMRVTLRSLPEWRPCAGSCGYACCFRPARRGSCGRASAPRRPQVVVAAQDGRMASPTTQP